MNSILKEKTHLEEVQPTKDNRNSDSTTYSVEEGRQYPESDILFTQAEQKMKGVRHVWNNSVDQPHITSEMIQKVVDWMFGNFWRLDLEDDVIFLTLNIMRLFLKNSTIQKARLQALAVTSLHISSKFILRNKITLDYIVDLCQQTYSKEDIVAMEHEILTVVDYNLDLPSFLHYVEDLKVYKSISSSEQSKIIFWAQLATVSDLLTDRNEERTVLDLFEFVIDSRNFLPDWIEKLYKFSQTTQLRYVMKRFMSCFDVDQYLQSILIQ